jgi:haloacid dehalogenase-like hydrolase
MSRLPPIPDPLDCVLFDAGDTLLAPDPSFQGRFVAVAADHGLPLEEAAVDAAIAAAVRAVEWPSDWTDPATQRGFWVGFYERVLADLGHHQGMELAEALFAAFSLFATVAVSGTLGVAKPDPEIFKAALAEAGAAPEQTVHVGDQPVNDVAAARAVGITPVLIDRFARFPDPGDTHRVEDLAGLVALVARDRPG